VINNKTAGDPKHWGKGYATAMITGDLIKIRGTKESGQKLMMGVAQKP